MCALPFCRIDQKLCGEQSGYRLKEAKAIVTELKSLRRAISSGEKEKQDLMQVLCVCEIFWSVCGFLYLLLRAPGKVMFIRHPTEGNRPTGRDWLNLSDLEMLIFVFCFGTVCLSTLDFPLESRPSPCSPLSHSLWLS